MPKVSIAVPICNVASFIEKSVRSFYEQTLDDIEIVLVDDCTPDNSIDIALKVLEEYPHRKNQVKVVHHEKNMGIAQTKKDCILNCSGDYFIVIDGDDYVDVRMTEKMYNKAIETSSDMVVCDYYEVNNSDLRVVSMLSNRSEKIEENIKKVMMSGKVPPFMQARLVRKAVITDNDMIWPKNNMGDDVVFSTMCALFSRKITYVNEPLFYYWRHSTSITMNESDDCLIRNFQSYQDNVQILSDYLEQRGLEKEYHEGIYRYKYVTKKYSLLVKNDRVHQKQFIRAFIEINKEMLWGSSSHKVLFLDWVIYILVWCGCYQRIFEFYHTHFSKNKNGICC